MPTAKHNLNHSDVAFGIHSFAGAPMQHESPVGRQSDGLSPKNLM